MDATSKIEYKFTCAEQNNSACLPASSNWIVPDARKASFRISFDNEMFNAHNKDTDIKELLIHQGNH